MRKMKVIYYAREELTREWPEAVATAFADQHELTFFDPSESVVSQFRDVGVVLDAGGWGTREMIDAATSAKLWQVLGTGLDHTELAYIKSKGIVVANCPGSLSASGLGDCAMMFILMITRQWHTIQANLQKGILWTPVGRNLEGLTLAIVGFGASGRELARRAKACGMRIEAIDVAHPDPQVLAEIAPHFMGTPDDLDDMIARCDFLSLHVPLNEHTRHLIDARRIGLMTRTASIINVARGAIVDEAAMYEALLEGRLAGAGLDAFSTEPPDLTEPALQLPNVYLTNHIAGATDATARRRAETALENVNRIACGKAPLHRVDL